MNKLKLMGTAYLPPIAWFQEIKDEKEVFIEAHEHYVKQSYRNRCKILTANGVMDLSIPIQHTGSKQNISEVQMQDQEPWRKKHWQAICSAYGKSAFFLYYRDAYEPNFLAPTGNNLFEHNLKLIQLTCKFLKLPTQFIPTSSFRSEPTDNLDLREKFVAKSDNRANELITQKAYLQVFSEKFRFEPNLSILDLLFNQGPMATDYL